MRQDVLLLLCTSTADDNDDDDDFHSSLEGMEVFCCRCFGLVLVVVGLHCGGGGEVVGGALVRRYAYVGVSSCSLWMMGDGVMTMRRSGWTD
jgi:hypothetical protein